MRIDLTGKRAIVTGSTGGIGLAIARGLAAAGARVVLNGRSQERLTHAIDDICAGSPDAKVTGVVADLAKASGASELIDQVKETDILVNNVGTGIMKPFGELTDDDWTSLFEINVMSGVRLTRHYLPGMAERGWGRVVFTSSEGALNIPPSMVSYGVSKLAQLGVARGAAESVAGMGVTVNSILAGPTRSEGVQRWLDHLRGESDKPMDQIERELLASVSPTSLIKRFASTEETANLAVYLCSEQASATTGSAIRVDGGVTRVVV